MNTKHLYNIYTILYQRRRRCINVIQIKCFCVLRGLTSKYICPLETSVYLICYDFIFRMQVAELVGPREPLRLTTREIPETPSEGFLLKTEYAGVCHSDCHFIDEDTSLGNGEFFKYSDVLGNYDKHYYNAHIAFMYQISHFE